MQIDSDLLDNAIKNQQTEPIFLWEEIKKAILLIMNC